MVGTHTIKIALIISSTVLWAGLARADEEYNPERYQVILDRSPFGEDPLSDEMVAQKQADAVAAAAAKDMRLCFLLENDDGEVRAGFQNLKPKPGDPKSVMLLEGESYREMKLLEIDLDNSSATLQLKGKPVMFTLTKAPAAKVAKKAPVAPTRKFGGGFTQRKPPAAPPKAAPLSPEEQARLRAETQENMRQYQMEVIRQGMPPLPVPLTQEMDDQLVSEGVLPPSM